MSTRKLVIHAIKIYLPTYLTSGTGYLLLAQSLYNSCLILQLRQKKQSSRKDSKLCKMSHRSLLSQNETSSWERSRITYTDAHSSKISKKVHFGEVALFVSNMLKSIFGAALFEKKTSACVPHYLFSTCIKN